MVLTAAPIPLAHPALPQVNQLDVTSHLLPIAQYTAKDPQVCIAGFDHSFHVAIDPVRDASKYDGDA